MQTHDAATYRWDAHFGYFVKFTAGPRTWAEITGAPGRRWRPTRRSAQRLASRLEAQRRVAA